VEGGIANLCHAILRDGLLGKWLPDLPAPTWMGAAEIARLQSRLTFGGIAIIFAVAVGYACFAYVSIAEGRRYFRVHAEMALAAEIEGVERWCVISQVERKWKGSVLQQSERRLFQLPVDVQGFGD
jgi:hypothetical protein